MDLKLIEEYLEQRGFSKEQLGEFTEPKVLSELGTDLVAHFKSNDELGDMVMSLLENIDFLANEIVRLNMKLEGTKNA